MVRMHSFRTTASSIHVTTLRNTWHSPVVGMDKRGKSPQSVGGSVVMVSMLMMPVGSAGIDEGVKRKSLESSTLQTLRLVGGTIVIVGLSLRAIVASC